jgi:hypothetical protein
MTTFISPESRITETAVGINISSPASNIGGMVGEFQTGPCYELTTITSVQDLEEIFGEPDSNNYKHFFTAWNFLQYANNLQIVRSIGKTSLNAGIALKQRDASPTTATSATVTRLNESDSPTVSFLTDDKLKFFFKYPGTHGNGYQVAICNYEDYDTIQLTHGTVTDGPFQVGEIVTDATTSAYGTVVVVGTGYIKVNSVFGTFGTNSIEGGTSTATATVSAVGSYAEVISGTTFDSLYDYSLDSDQVLVVVLDSSDNILEVFKTSLTVGEKDSNGSVIYIEDYLERESQYVYAYDNTTQTTIPATYGATALAGGTVVNPSNSEIQECWEQYLNPDNSNAWVLMLGGYNENSTIQKYVIQSIADERKDIFVICGPTQASCVGVALESTTSSNIIEHRVTTLAVNSSYAGYFGNYAYIEDTYNSTKRWIPLDGFIGGAMIETAEQTSVGRFSWGYTYGQLKNVIKLAWNPSKTYRDALWKKEINSVIKDGSLFLIFGNKSLLGISNVFDVIDVRLLFNFIKRGLKPFLKLYISEKNVTLTRRRLTNSINSFLDPLVGTSDIDEYRVEAGESVNTPDVLARNELKCLVAIKPTSSIRFVSLLLYALASNIDIDEVISNQG